MGKVSTAFVEVPLLAHDKEEDVPSLILQPCSKQKQCTVEVYDSSECLKSGNWKEDMRKSRYQSDEKENGVAIRKKFKGVDKFRVSDPLIMSSNRLLSPADAGTECLRPRKRKRSQQEISSSTEFISLEDEEATSSDSDKVPQKILELEALQDRQSMRSGTASHYDPGSAPKRANRKQKRVQLKQLSSFSDSKHQDNLPREANDGTHRASEERPKPKHKSVKYLLTTTKETDHVWSSRKESDHVCSASKIPASTEQDWREIDLDSVDPLELIGRSCKVFWPLDTSWYTGAIREYNHVSKKHRVDYMDSEMEWLCLSKERVKFQIGFEEENTLRSASTNHQPNFDVDELAVLAHEIESCRDQIGHGDIVWAKVKGWPMWPALVLDEEQASKFGLELPSRKLSFAVQFFGTSDFARLNNDKVVAFAKGVMLKYHLKCKRPAFHQGLREVERYLKQGRLPQKMAQIIEMQSATKHELKSSETSDAEDFIGDERENPIKTSIANIIGCPLDIGGLRILSLGKIVLDSELFHDNHYIWPEGYTSVRVFPSIKDPNKLVDYRMEVVRNQYNPCLPLFRVTPADSEPIEGRSAAICWKNIYNELSRVTKTSGALEFKRKSGLSMFGFNNPRVFKLIQALPNAHVCSNFLGWDNLHSTKAEWALPPGYRSIDVQWKHLERCSVCYVEEEYMDNLLLQCAKCRIMVHMGCYGEVESPADGFWLCKLCQRNTSRVPPCCLCPIAGGAMKETTDGRWAHLTCAMWIPETCLVDVKKMEPIGGLSSIHKERWKLLCCVCEVSYGACIQCVHQQCMTSYHPLCARAAGFFMEVQEDSSDMDCDRPLQLLSLCPKHRTDAVHERTGAFIAQGCSSFEQLNKNKLKSSGCSRCEPYDSRSGHRRQVKRSFVEKTPYIVGSVRGNFPRGWRLVRTGKFHRSVWEDSFADGSPKKAEDTVLSMSARLEYMRSTMRQRLTFGKSAIHDWGVFSKQVHQPGDMVVEYAGEIVRPTIADMREQRHYNALVGEGTYMFRIDDERVVDATHAGSIAHLINHSCEPNCYSRTVTVNGVDLIIIFAKRKISAGEELTYDYRFTSKGEGLICNCGAAKCRGRLRGGDESDGSRILVPHSLLRKWAPQQPS